MPLIEDQIKNLDLINNFNSTEISPQYFLNEDSNSNASSGYQTDIVSPYLDEIICVNQNTYFKL